MGHTRSNTNQPFQCRKIQRDARWFVPLFRFFSVTVNGQLSTVSFSRLPCWPRLRRVRASSGSGRLHWLLIAMRRSLSRMAVRPGGGAGIAGLRDFQLLAHHVFQLFADILVFFQEDARIFPALTHALPPKPQPRSTLFHQTLVATQINTVAFA